MNCVLCNSENRPEAKFCDSCGAALQATVAKTEDPMLDAVRAAFTERYFVETQLGQGGMGVVYRARERSLDRHVALKVIPEERNRDTTFVERFRREARLAARLRHPRIVSVHEVGTLGGLHYFSMDYIEGSTLRAVVRRRKTLPVEDAVSVVTEICRAVAHAHSKGTIHRDLKPENVMIDHEGDVFVMDFGLARSLEDESGLTQSGMIMGSPTYMSPEQLEGQQLDERTDVYSLGLILYFCLTGEDMFAADTITGVVVKHHSTRAADVIRNSPAIPAHLQDILISMLQEDREQRARTAREILERLTLRTIVALGKAATGESQSQEAIATITVGDFATREAEPPPATMDDPAAAAMAAKRKARLRSLLDEM